MKNLPPGYIDDVLRALECSADEVVFERRDDRTEVTARWRATDPGGKNYVFVSDGAKEEIERLARSK